MAFDFDLASLLATNSHKLDGYIHTLVDKENIVGTNVVGYCHVLKRDSRKVVMISELLDYLIARAIQYVFPPSKIKSAMTDDASVAYNMSLMSREALGKFSSRGNLGEVGELLLYLLAEEVLQSPQLICKMSLKTNPNMPVHGRDGVHVSNRDGQLVLYWGESKMHKNFSDGVREAANDLEAFFFSEEGTALPDELKLIKEHISIGEADLQDLILGYLDPGSKQYGEAIYEGVCFIGFDEKGYDQLDHDSLVSTLSESYKNWCEVIKKQVSGKKIKDFKLHFFLLPFPDVEHFRDEFVNRVSSLTLRK